MSQDILPIFVDGKTPESTSRALSEVFLQPDAFTVGLEHRAPAWKPEELVGLRTLYLGPPIAEGTPGELATFVDPAERFGDRFEDAAKAFLKGYFQQLAPLKAALKPFLED